MPDIFCDNICIKCGQTLLLLLTLLQLLLWLLLCLNQCLIVTALWLIFCYYNLPEQVQSTHLTNPCLFSKHSHSFHHSWGSKSHFLHPTWCDPHYLPHSPLAILFWALPLLHCLLPTFGTVKHPYTLGPSLFLW